MPTRWAVWFSVAGDLRFLSHHDMMRLVERAATRACLPLKYSQGFNPHPRLSLTWPRPVGIASQCELLTLELAADAPDAAWSDQFGRQLPRGMELRQVDPLAGRKPPQVLSCSYEMELAPAEAAEITRQLDWLAQLEIWEVVRRSGPEGPDAPAGKPIDIKPRLRELKLEGARLSFTLAVEDGKTARPGEVLTLLFGGTGLPTYGPVSTGESPGLGVSYTAQASVLPDLDPAETAVLLARLVRTRLECRFE